MNQDIVKLDKPIKAWWFASETDGLRYRDNRVPYVGDTHTYHGKLLMCNSGLHASRSIHHAARYHVSPYLYRVSLSGKCIRQADKICASERTYIARVCPDLVLDTFRKCIKTYICSLSNTKIDGKTIDIPTSLRKKLDKWVSDDKSLRLNSVEQRFLDAVRNNLRYSSLTLISARVLSYLNFDTGYPGYQKNWTCRLMSEICHCQVIPKVVKSSGFKSSFGEVKKILRRDFCKAVGEKP